MIGQAPSAFCFSTEHVHTDQGLVVLMAKHILEGGEFPVFQYDTSHLGSLEAFLLSICYLLFGINLWVIHIVPVVCFTLICFALFHLAKDLFGTQAGLWALLWFVFTPITLSEYSVLPQLGNISAPMLGTVLLCITIKSLKSSDLFTKRGSYGLLGLLAGIGWWTSPMVIYYLFTIPLFILFKEKSREILKGGGWGVFLFFVGALPFFCYYALDPQLKILGMGEGYSLKNLKEGLPLFFLERIPYFLDLDKLASLHPIYYWLGAVVYLGATVFFFWGLRRDFVYLLKPRSWSKISPGFILGLFFLIFLGTLCSSIHIKRHALRYFLPLASFFPIALAYWMKYFPKKWRPIPIFLCLLLLLMQAEASWKFIKVQAPLAEAQTKDHIRLVNGLAGKGNHQVYSWSYPGSEIINFYSRERVISSQPMQELYRPYEDILESADLVAFIDPGDRPIPPSLGVIGGNCRQEKLEKGQLYNRFTPPLREYREISREGFRFEVSDQQVDVQKMVDRNLDTGWSSVRTRSPDMWLKIDLGKNYPLGMIRLYNPGAQHGYYSLNLEIQASSDDLHWQAIVPETKMDYYYWDGPRLYFWELNYRWECRFGPLKARYLLIKNKEREKRFPWNIGELYIYENQGAQKAASFDQKLIIHRIQDLGLKKIYAGRWLSAKIKKTTKGRTQTIPTFTVASFVRWPRSRVVEFGPQTGFIVDQQDQSGFEELLDQAGIQLACEPIGRWRLYHFKEWGLRQKNLENHRGFWWTGFGVLKAGPAVWDEFHRRGLDQWN